MSISINLKPPNPSGTRQCACMWQVKKISAAAQSPVRQLPHTKQQQKPGNFSNGDLRSNSPLRNILLAGQLLNWSWH